MLKLSHRVGHAKTTRGKQSPDGVKEWAQAVEIFKLVYAELANYENVAQKRFDDPTGMIDKPTGQLAREVNDWGSHVHIDYHHNGHGDGLTWTDGHGIETFVALSKAANKENVELAKKVQANMVKNTGLRDRGVKYFNWDMVNLVKCPSILVEMGFMTNKKDTAVIRSKTGQQQFAKAIVDGLVSQYNLKRRPEPVKVVKVEAQIAGTLSHKIVKGDTLWTLAKKYKTTVDALKKLNPTINPDALPIGKILVISGTSTVQYHTVVKGDVVSRLAARYGSTIKQIKDWNKLDNNYTIRIGQRIRVK